MKTAMKVALTLFLALSLISCATMRPDLTPEQKQLAAVKWFNDNLEEYLTAYDMASPETRAKWDERITPLFIQGNTVLELWRVGQMAESDWFKLRNTLIAALITNGLIVVEE